MFLAIKGDFDYLSLTYKIIEIMLLKNIKLNYSMQANVVSMSLYDAHLNNVYAGIVKINPEEIKITLIASLVIKPSSISSLYHLY